MQRPGLAFDAGNAVATDRFAYPATVKKASRLGTNERGKVER